MWPVGPAVLVFWRGPRSEVLKHSSLIRLSLPFRSTSQRRGMSRQEGCNLPKIDTSKTERSSLASQLSSRQYSASIEFLIAETLHELRNDVRSERNRRGKALPLKTKHRALEIIPPNGPNRIGQSSLKCINYDEVGQDIGTAEQCDRPLCGSGCPGSWAHELPYFLA